MIEMLGVLAIIGVLSAGGIMGYSKAMENYLVNKLIDNMSTFAYNAANIFILKKMPLYQTGEGIKGNKLCPLGIVSGTYCQNKSPFDTRIDTFLRQNSASTQIYFGFDLFYPTDSVCIKLLTYNWRAFFTQASAVGAKDGIFLWSINPLPATMSVAKARCASLRTNGNLLNINLSLQK